MRQAGQPSSSTSLEPPRDILRDSLAEEENYEDEKSKDTSVAEVNLSALDLNRSDIKIKPQAEEPIAAEVDPLYFEEEPDYRDSFGVGLYSRERDNLRKPTPFSPDLSSSAGAALQEEGILFSTSESPFSHVID
mmetsp:Transcript_35780/g.54815  ORF Transcript_35780/g.54815 Transcript_35780/m.54815 type:complete len:134 (+) Transcript_35780:1499-1900(+)